VDVHGLLATTSNISNENFMAGQYQFDVPSLAGGVVANRGQINASQGGLVALVAPGVINEGIINARLGRVSLAAGNTFTLDLYGDQLVNLGVGSQVMRQITGLDGQSLTSLVSNKGAIYADGGTVRLDVNAASGIVDHVINMEGIIQARSIEKRNGVIILSGGDSGQVSVSGTLDASGYSAGETGGTVHVLGNRVGLYGPAVVDVSGDLGGGELLFGGDYQGKGVVHNASETYVAREASIYADAITFGDGGQAIFWADRRTRFLGRVSARGGRERGNGGLVEISGKEELYFDGLVDTTAPNGETGLLLLDPENIEIVDGSGATASGAATFSFSEQTLEANSATSNISLVADNSIIIRNLSDNVLDLKQTSGHSVTFTATDGSITFESIDDKVQTAGGDLFFLAGGDLTLGSLQSNGGDISLLGTDLIIFGSVNAGTGDLSLRASKNGPVGGVIGLAGTSVDTSTLCDGAACDFTVDATELQNMTARNLFIGPQTTGSITSGDIFVAGLTSADTGNISGEVSLVATHISGSEGTITFNGDSTFSGLNANAVNGIVVNGNLTTLSGNLVLDGDTDNFLDTNSPDKNNIALASGITLTSAGDLRLSATTNGISAEGAVTLSAANQMEVNHSLTAIGSATLNAGTGISLGSGMVLTSGNTLALASTIGSISGAGNLTMSADNGISLGNSLTAAGNLSLEGDADNNSDGTDSIALASGTTLTSTGGSMILNATTGGIAISSGTTLSAASGITLNDSLTTAGTTTISADSNADGSGDFTLASGKTLATGNNNLFITANDINLSGSLNSGTAATSIAVSDGGSLGIGSVNCGSTCGMTLDATEMGNINENGLSLTGSSIYFAAGQSLSSTGILTLGSSGGSITGAGDLTLSGTDGLVLNSSLISSGGSLTLSSTNDAITTGGAATLNAVSGVTINDDFTAGGAVVVDADSNDDGTGNFTLASGKNLSTSNNGLTITSNDIILDGSINSGTGSTTFLVSDGGSIGLGDTAGNWTLNGSELQRLTTGNLVIGNSSNGSITVDNIISANSGNVAGTLTLNTGSSVSFANNASVFQGGLAVNAENGVTLSANVTTAGTTSLDADSNDDGTGDLTLASALNSGNNTISLIGADLVLTGSVNSGTAGTAVEVSKAGKTLGLGIATADMTIDSSEMALISAGSRTFGGSANGGITVDSLTVSNPLTLLATRSGSSVDFQGSSTFGDLTVNTGGSIADSSGSLSVSGTSSFTGSQGITLDNAGNAYGGLVDLTSNDSAVFSTNSALTLGTSNIGNDLTVTVGGGNAIAVNGVQSAGGKLFFTAGSDITLTGSLVSASSSSFAIQLVSATGGIFDGDTTGALDIDTPTGGLLVDVASGFGTASNPLETRVASVDIDNSTSGEINIFETDSLNVVNITQNADPGDILVSYSGMLSGQDNAFAQNGSISFVQRNTGGQLVGGTGKTLSDLSLETTVKLSGEIEANYFPGAGSSFSGDNSVSSGLTATASQPFVADVFSEDFELVEMAKGNGAKKRLKGLSSFWSPMIDENAEVVKKPKRNRSRQEAKGKGKSRKGKINKVEKKAKPGAKIASRSPQPREKSNDGNSSSLFSSFLNLFR
jgi:hypothetical protein